MHGSSGFDETSTSYDDDVIYSMPLNDKYMWWNQIFLNEKRKKKERPTVGELTKYLSFKKLQAHILEYNHMGRETNQVSF